MHRTVEELVSIAAAGGGMTLNMRELMTADIIRIAEAASIENAKLVVTGTNGRPTQDLIRIAEAGKGLVVFEP